MLTIIRTDTDHPDLPMLITALDTLLAIRNGADHSFYAQYNKLDHIKQVVIAYEQGQPVGCGAIKAHEAAQAAEVKRMFVVPAYRGKGVASAILAALETWAAELQFSHCILETGTMLPEAIALYQKNGYHIIPNYGQYAGNKDSVCMKKAVSPTAG